MKTCYKLLTEGSSYAKGILPCNWRINYRKAEGQWVKPNMRGTRLYVFRSVTEAARYDATWTYNNRTALWRCEYRGNMQERGIAETGSEIRRIKNAKEWRSAVNTEYDRYWTVPELRLVERIFSLKYES